MKNFKKIIIIMFTVLLMVTWTACASNGDTTTDTEGEGQSVESETTYPLTVTDNLGNEVTFDKEPEKIVSVSPDNTETLFALGLGDKVVGVTEYCDYPEEAMDKEKIGGYSDPNTEKIIDLDPDVVFAYSSVPDDMRELLEASGIKVFVFYAQSIDEVLENIKTTATIANVQENATELVENMQAKREDIISKVQDAEPRKVFHDFGDFFTAGPDTYMDSMFNELNAINIAGDAESQWPQFSLEKVVEADPDVYITSRPVEDVKKIEGLESTTAYQNDHIVEMTFEDNNMVARSGPRVVDGLEVYAKAIYPELFE